MSHGSWARAPQEESLDLQQLTGSRMIACMPLFGDAPAGAKEFHLCAPLSLLGAGCPFQTSDIFVVPYGRASCWPLLAQRGRYPPHRSNQITQSLPISHGDATWCWALRGEPATKTTPRGFEPLRAEPNGFLVHLLSHSDTVSYVCGRTH